jgi:hypothetical protein
MIIKFVFDRETKGTVRYAEKAPLGQPEVVGTLYIRKWALEQLAGEAGNGPAELTVEITGSPAEVPWNRLSELSPRAGRLPDGGSA